MEQPSDDAVSTHMEQPSDDAVSTHMEQPSDDAVSTHMEQPSTSTASIKMKKAHMPLFKTSNILKHNTPIFIEYNIIIDSLRKLDYEDYYILYVVSFRTLLEDISKRYLNLRGIKLEGDFAHNVAKMIIDVSLFVFDKTSYKKEKLILESLFGGYNALKTFLQSIEREFYHNGTQGPLGTTLNSYTHNPRFMPYKEAERIANDIILPLYVILNHVKSIFSSPL